MAVAGVDVQEYTNRRLAELKPGDHVTAVLRGNTAVIKDGDIRRYVPGDGQGRVRTCEGFYCRPDGNDLLFTNEPNVEISDPIFSINRGCFYFVEVSKCFR